MTVKAVKAVTPSKPQTKPNTAVPSQATNAAPTATPTATPTSVPTPTPDPNIFKMEGEQVKPTDADTRATYTLNSDGSVTVKAGWKYYAIAFESPLNLNKVKSITIEGSASAGFRLSFGNKDGEYFIDHENLDSWVYPNKFNDSITIDLTEKNPSGKADWLFLGTKDNDEVTFNIKSISFKLGAENLENVNTDGLTEAIKEVGNNNPIAAQRFMADPYAIEYNGRVYVYGTNDSQSMRIGEDGKIPNNTYSNINTLNCYSSADMVNWRDEGIIQVAGKKGPASWSKNSWAPAVCYKNIDGKDKFFIYFADNGSGIGVLEGDSPTGPWHDPIGKQLISRNTPNCGGSEVPWLFDPAVFVDDDGQGYLYFGGIGEAEDREHPNCIRVVKLGDDMISLKEDPVVIDAPAPFEDSGINKFNGKYYYSYCTNWDGAKKRPTTNELGVANIAYMVSDSPM
ncbi:MAG: family 43 glycosylhydrolase, partial [Eubacterium sp.]|nr:family 43 glycosylhydrolase [Eubacterium sp.]